jgi:hypothetical protein
VAGVWRERVAWSAEEDESCCCVGLERGVLNTGERERGVQLFAVTDFRIGRKMWRSYWWDSVSNGSARPEPILSACPKYLSGFFFVRPCNATLCL